MLKRVVWGGMLLMLAGLMSMPDVGAQALRGVGEAQALRGGVEGVALTQEAWTGRPLWIAEAEVDWFEILFAGRVTVDVVRARGIDRLGNTNTDGYSALVNNKLQEDFGGLGVGSFSTMATVTCEWDPTKGYWMNALDHVNMREHEISFEDSDGHAIIWVKLPEGFNTYMLGVGYSKCSNTVSDLDDEYAREHISWRLIKFRDQRNYEWTYGKYGGRSLDYLWHDTLGVEDVLLRDYGLMWHQDYHIGEGFDLSQQNVGALALHYPVIRVPLTGVPERNNGTRGLYEGVDTLLVGIYGIPLQESWLGNPAGEATYTGEPVLPTIATMVTSGNYVLQAGEDYVLQGVNNVNAGTGTVYVIGTEHYGDTLVRSFRILPKTLSAASGITIADIPAQRATGQPVMPEVTVHDGERELVRDRDYELMYSNNVLVGSASVRITGKANYTGSMDKTFSISNKTMIQAEWIRLAQPSYLYTSEPVEPAVEVWVNSTTRLRAGIDYSVAYVNNVRTGTATVVVTGMGEYDGEATAEFSIGSMAFDENCRVEVSDAVYTGLPLTPTVTVRYESRRLKEGDDFTVVYSNNVEAGSEALVTVYGAGDFAGVLSKTFVIQPKTFGGERLQIASLVYTGEAQTPATVQVGGATLTVGKDFEIVAIADDNINAGTVRISIRGTHNYTGELSGTFEIEPKSFDAGVRIEPVADVVATGEYRTPALSVYDGGRLLVASHSYYVEGRFVESAEAAGLRADYVAHYTNCREVGTADVAIEGVGNYRGALTATFRIVEEAPSEPVVEPSTPSDSIAPTPVDSIAPDSVTPEPVDSTPDNPVEPTPSEPNTGVEAEAGDALRAVAEGGNLAVSGLRAGEVFAVYNLQGQTLYQATAGGSEVSLPLRDKGFYILRQRGRVCKFSVY